MGFFKPAKSYQGNSEQPRWRSSDRVRDHLANERTYLAWMRSGIALLGFGVVIRIIRPPLAPQTPGNGWKFMAGSKSIV